ncbi:MAG: HAMP domain-containing histidine kinase [Tannerella sp.]|jgi:two-component system phosphate regulon sensor histidine kinase PhoR|nr:HAMP domain-containing histidine kinase [Tannerella sp.]
MEKRIRIVWLLSLGAAFLAVGVQGYWLYNQYRYVIDAYSAEIAERALSAGEKEYEMRRSGNKSPMMYIVQSREMVAQEAGDGETPKEQHNRMFQFHLGADSAKTADGQDVAPLIFDMKASLPPENFKDDIDRMIADRFNPFDIGRLDSILHADIPEAAYTTTEWHDADTVYMTSHWKRTGSLLRPQVEVFYAYNPLNSLGVRIVFSISPQPVFSRMAMQWALAFGLILLLAACFGFQIKTIMKQHKISSLREHFVNTMIHELKRPVQTLKTFVSFLGDRDLRSDNEATEQVVQDSMFELDNLSVYLNKLKDMLRADSEGTALNCSRFDLKALTDRVIRLTQTPAGKTVNITTAFLPDEAIEAEADPVHIANVLNNLIENAVKYSHDRVDIHIQAVRTAKGIELSVADNGFGIPAAEQQRVFDKFYRGTNISDRNIPGLGLGLSYVRLIVRAHRGEVTLASRTGRGTTVTLLLPQ